MSDVPYGKLVHHRCGYPLWVKAMHQFASVVDEVVPGALCGDVLVEYRDGSGLMVWMCPGCCGPLKLWWKSDGRHVEMSSGGGWDVYGERL